MKQRCHRVTVNHQDQTRSRVQNSPFIQKGEALWGKLNGQQYLCYHASEKVDRFFIKEVVAEFQFGREDGKVIRPDMAIVFLCTSSPM